MEILEKDPAERAGTNEEVLAPFAAHEAQLEAMRCLYCHEPQCVSACPIGQDCREYTLKIAEGRFDEAAEIILRDNPLASTLSRVCYHYCEESCVVGLRGEPVALRHLKRSALQHGRSKDEPWRREGKREGRVAVVGGGPAGLMVSWILARKGYDVTVYEARETLGGLATLTIPLYRLPREIFERDLERMRNLGIVFEKSARMGRDFTLEDLRARHDAIFLGLGTHRPKALRIPGVDLPGVHSPLAFLEDAALGRPTRVGERVAVIGGGDVAMDCARVSFRLGAKEVHVVYRRSREEMPASDEEVREAQDEGVIFDFLVSPVRIEGEGRVERLICQRMELGAPDESGRRRPVPVPGSEFAIPVDAVLPALGQVADLSGIPNAEALGISIDSDGVLAGLDASGRTKLPDVFVGGGISVVHAMATGKRAADAMERHLETKGERRIRAREPERLATAPPMEGRVAVPSPPRAVVTRDPLPKTRR